MKTHEELKRMAVQEANAEQKRIEHLRPQLRSQFEREVREYADVKIKQLIADAENTVKEYYMGKKKAAPYHANGSGLMYSEDGIVFKKRRYYYHCCDTVRICFQKTDTWNKFYSLRTDDDGNRIHELYLLEPEDPKMLRRIYGRVHDEYCKCATKVLQEIVPSPCDDPPVRFWISGSRYLSDEIVWSVALGNLDDVK